MNENSMLVPKRRQIRRLACRAVTASLLTVPAMFLLLQGTVYAPVDSHVNFRRIRRSLNSDHWTSQDTLKETNEGVGAGQEIILCGPLS